MSIGVVFGARRLLPAVGGGERYALELLAHLAERHRVHALWLGGEPCEPAAVTAVPPGVTGTEVALPRGLRAQARAMRRLERELAAALDGSRPGVVFAQAGAETAAVAAARERGAAAVLLLPSYDSLCRHAFAPGSGCRPETGCLGCRLGPGRALLRRGLARSRALRREALLGASALIAPSEAVADVYEAWIGRRPAVAAPIDRAHPPVAAARDGHVLLATALWSREKGRDLLVPIAAGLPERHVVVTRPGLEPAQRRSLERLPNVTLTWYAPIGRLLTGAGVALMPSQWREPFGRIAFEALSAGVPALASATGGLVELVPEEQLVRPHDDPAAWTAAVRALDGEPAWEAARERGRRAAETVLATRPLERVEAILVAAARRG